MAKCWFEFTREFLKNGKMKGIRRNIRIAGLTLLLAGCGENRVVNSSYQAPEGNAGEGESIGNIDWAAVRRDNPGYEIDMNGDGKNDFAILQHDGRNFVLYFGNGGDRQNLIPILKMNGQISAYTIGTHKDITRPSLIYFTPDGKGYLRENLGQNKEGIPFFGGEQSVE